jgi:hypothetical protein
VTTGPANAGDGAGDLPDLPFSPAPIEELLRLLVKGVRAHQLYLPNNPVYKGAVDAVRNAFAPIWELTDQLALTFTDTEVRWMGRPVLVEQSKTSDSLAWTFHKDGVREVQFTRGFEQDELVRLFDILQRVRKASPEEDDLLTMLWQADFAYLRYRYVDLGAEPVAPLADGGPPVVAAEPGAVRAALQDTPPESRPAVVNMKNFDATLYFLDDKELAYLRQEIDREYHGELRRTVAATLFDIFESQPTAAIREEVAEDIEYLMLSLLATGELRTVAYILAETQVAVARASSVTDEQREQLGQLPERLSAAEPLGQLLQALDESAELPPAAELSELFQQLRPTALGTIFAWLPRLQNASIRTMVESAAERLAAGNTSDLVRLISSHDAVVAAEAIRRATSMKTAAAVAPLGRVLAEGDASLRLLAVAALTAIGSPGALQALERAIEDPDREVRVAAVRTLGARAYRGVFGRIESVVKGKHLRDADLTERMAFFEAFGAMCGEGGVAFLDGILNGKGLFGRREDPELRACAAMALGRIGSQRAQESLQKAATEKDVVVRNAVNRALRQS